MNWWANRRNQVIAAQSVVVTVLCVAVYFGLLRPGSSGSLNGVTAPDGYQGVHASGPSHQPRHGHRPVGGRGGGGARGRATGSVGAVATGGGTGGLATVRIGGSGTPSLPSGNQYESAVTALSAKVGPAPARAP